MLVSCATCEHARCERDDPASTQTAHALPQAVVQAWQRGLEASVQNRPAVSPASESLSAVGHELAMTWQRGAAARGAQIQDRQYSSAVLEDLGGLPVPTSAGQIAQLGRHE